MTAREEARGIWLAPDWTGLAIEAEDGSLVEVGREHGYGAWVSQGMLDVVPDSWVRLMPPPDGEEVAVLRARLALSPVQVEAMEQEIAELKQEHGVLSGQLHEIRAVLDDPAYDRPTSGRAVHRNNDEKLNRIRAIVDREPLPGQPEGQSPWDAYVKAYREYQETDPHGATAHPTAHHMHALDAALLAATSTPPDRETEWGCLDRHGQVHTVGVENEAQARAMRSMTPVRREVGPWTEVQP